jgi:hypothetical protein
MVPGVVIDEATQMQLQSTDVILADRGGLIPGIAGKPFWNVASGHVYDFADPYEWYAIHIVCPYEIADAAGDGSSGGRCGIEVTVYLAHPLIKPVVALPN